MATKNLSLENFFSTTLAQDITASSTTIYLNSVPSSAEGYLVLEKDSVSAREIIYYTSKGANFVTCPSAVAGRGVGGTTAQAHTAGVSCDMTFTAEYWDALKEGTILGGSGWTLGPTTTFASADSPTFTATQSGDFTDRIYPGVRVKLEQTQAIQNYWSFDTDSADSKGSATMANIGTPTYTSGKFGNALTLNGTNQALRITDAAAFHLGASGAEFTVGAWIKTSATGANKCIYASYSDNTNANGVIFQINAANKLGLYVGNNAAGPVTACEGTTTVTDGNLHYAVVTFRNNYAQIYLDGKLEASGYSPTPTYAATTYTNIGAYCETSTTPSAGTWFNGQIDDLFIAAYALDEQTIKAKYDAATAQGTGDLTLTKYFLCTASSYSAPNTTVTLYGGTDHTLSNATISNAYYSSQKAPYGFPLKEEKWTVVIALASLVSLNLSLATITNVGSFSATCPIGSWDRRYQAYAFVSNTASNTTIFSLFSDTNSTAGDIDLQAFLSTNSARTGGSFAGRKPVTNSAKKTYYLNWYISEGSGTLGFVLSNAFIKFVSTLL